MGNHKPNVRFRVNFEKCIEGIDLLAQRKPGITQYYICKVFYFADKEHLMDWGRPISGDRFVAMEHGPVPSFIYDVLKDASAEPDEIIDELNSRVRITPEHNRLRVYTKGNEVFKHLSGTDIDYLERALYNYGSMSFGRLKKISHEDPAYEEAWSKPGLNNEMDIRLWFKSDDWDEDAVIAELEERAALSRAERAA